MNEDCIIFFFYWNPHKYKTKIEKHSFKENCWKKSLHKTEIKTIFVNK